MSLFRRGCVLLLAHCCVACGESAGAPDMTTPDLATPPGCATAGTQADLGFTVAAPLAPDGGVTTLGACGTVTGPAAMVLTADLTATDVACLTIAGDDVDVDCQMHAISGAPAVTATGASNVRLHNCVLAPRFSDPAHVVPQSYHTVDLKAVSAVEISGATITGAVSVSDSQRVRFAGNTLTANGEGAYSQTNTRASELRDNSIVIPSTMQAATSGIATVGGGGNRIAGNTIAGGWDGVRHLDISKYIGADDGIVVQDEAGDVVESNVIHDIWDSGVETLGVVDDCVFAGNQITNAAISGIGGWYDSSVARCTFVGNRAQHAGGLFLFFRDWGLRAGETQVFFADNLFVDNQLVDWVSGITGLNGMPQSTADIPLYDELDYDGKLSPTPRPGETVPTASQFVLDGNAFLRNDFTAMSPRPNFGASPPVPGRVLDCGGNHCAAGDTRYPLRCQ